MKALCILALVLLSAFTTAINKLVERVDLNRYAGKWYSLYSIPAFFDKGSYKTTTSYN
jgi:apolipoprotein D and lipocalin family protein